MNGGPSKRKKGNKMCYIPLFVSLLQGAQREEVPKMNYIVVIFIINIDIIAV
jgi:hypothetical protein